MVVVELKRDRTPRDVVAQALEYAAYAAKLDAGALEGILGEYHLDEPLGLVEQHREYFDQSEAVAFNKNQRIVIIGQQVTPEIRQAVSVRLRPPRADWQSAAQRGAGLGAPAASSAVGADGRSNVSL